LILHVFSREINENNVHVDWFSLSHLTECKCKDCSQKVATYAAGKESLKKFRLPMIKKFDLCDNQASWDLNSDLFNVSSVL